MDGQAIPDLFSHREISPVFDYTLPPANNIAQFFGINVSGPVSGAIADGYYVMLKPLQQGEHVINFGGTNPTAGFSLDVTYNIDVVPKGQYDQQIEALDAAATTPGSSGLPGDHDDSPLFERLKK